MDPLRRARGLIDSAHLSSSALVNRTVQLASSALDYSAPTLGGVALWLFTVTGWPLFVQPFRTSDGEVPPAGVEPATPRIEAGRSVL